MLRSDPTPTFSGITPSSCTPTYEAPNTWDCITVISDFPDRVRRPMPRPVPYSLEINADTGLIMYAPLPTSPFHSLNRQSRRTGPTEWQTPDPGVSRGSRIYHPPHHTSLLHRNSAFKTGTFTLSTSYYPRSYITPNPSQSSSAHSEDK